MSSENKNDLAPLIPIGQNFWTLRASFTVLLGLVEIGTHMSFIKLSSGKFLILDTCSIPPEAKVKIDQLTSNGELIEAVLATHPFHTLYFEAFHKLYPNAKYYGCPRHLRNITSVPWAGNILDHLQQWEGEGVFLRVPEGSDIDPVDQNNHLSSVIVFHRESKTIFVDDTIMVYDDPGCVLRVLGARPGAVGFWAGGFKKGLKASKEAPLEFKAAIEKIIEDWDFENIAAAHCGNFIGGAKEKLRRAIARASNELQSMHDSR